VCQGINLVPKEKEEDFIESFGKYTTEFMKNEESDYTRIVNKKHFNRLSGYLKQGELLKTLRKIRKMLNWGI